MRQLKQYQLLRAIALRWRRWRSCHSYISGKNNTCTCNGIRISTKIQISGDGNYINIQHGAVLIDCLIRISGSNNNVFIDTNAYLENAEIWIEDNHSNISVGQNTYIGHSTQLACTEDNQSIVIGNDCMLSSYVQIRTGDSHSILTLQGKRTNSAASVRIDNHCWIGQGSKILKGSIITHDSIIGTGAIVSGRFDPNVIIAGIPGRVVKENVTWDSRRL